MMYHFDMPEVARRLRINGARPTVSNFLYVFPM